MRREAKDFLEPELEREFFFSVHDRAEIAKIIYAEM
jgi:hypothetical protein